VRTTTQRERRRDGARALLRQLRLAAAHDGGPRQRRTVTVAQACVMSERRAARRLFGLATWRHVSKFEAIAGRPHLPTAPLAQMETCSSRAVLAAAPAARRVRAPCGAAAAPRRAAGRRSLAVSAALTPISNAEAAFPWRTAAGPVSVRAEGPPPMTPRFMEASGPTDPMALLMRQRIVFLGTQARARGGSCWQRARRAAGRQLVPRGVRRSRRRVAARRHAGDDAAQP
jgi:hypothetical protein